MTDPKTLDATTLLAVLREHLPEQWEPFLYELERRFFYQVIEILWLKKGIDVRGRS